MIAFDVAKAKTDWAQRHTAARPILSAQEAASFSRANVLARVGLAGKERLDPWDPDQSDGVEAICFKVNATNSETGSYSTIQKAVDAAISNAAVSSGAKKAEIRIAPGIYGGLVYVPRFSNSKVSIALVGEGKSPNDVVIQADIDAEMPVDEYVTKFGAQFADAGNATHRLYAKMASGDRLGTFRSAVVRVEADNTEIRNLTIHNSYQANRAEAAPKGAFVDVHGRFSEGQHQAVALHLAGADRVLVDGVHLKSFQDTLYLAAPKAGVTCRAFFKACDIEGDVDFIFGQSTAFFESCTIRSLGERKAKSWVTAPATHIHTTFGFVFDGCHFTHDGDRFSADRACALGRQWFQSVRATPYGTGGTDSYETEIGSNNTLSEKTSSITAETLTAVGKCVLIDCTLGHHISPAAPWDDWSGPGYARDGCLKDGAWSPRYRPHQTCLSDMKEYLRDWPSLAALDLDQPGAQGPWLGEFNTVHLGAVTNDG